MQNFNSLCKVAHFLILTQNVILTVWLIKTVQNKKGSGKLITNTCTNRQTDRQVGNIMPQTAHRMGDTGQKKHNTIPVILTIL